MIPPQSRTSDHIVVGDGLGLAGQGVEDRGALGGDVELGDGALEDGDVWVLDCRDGRVLGPRLGRVILIRKSKRRADRVVWWICC
jgi:hypothetical protein